MRKLMLIVIVLFFSLSAFGQLIKQGTHINIFYSDSVFIPDPVMLKQYNPQSSLWVPFAESFGTNVAIWSFNRYVTDAHHARISFESVKNNFKRGWAWDSDGILVNMFGHPYQGAIYYNLARTNGYDYYSSLGVTAFGSWQWEFFMEIQPPAINDFVMTTFAGSMYGEILYRITNHIIDESTTGSERTWREVATTFNPSRLFNRLIYGRTSRTIDAKLYECRPNVGELALGGNNVAEEFDFKNGKKNPMLTFNYNYGHPFFSKTYKPMDYFNLYIALNFGGDQNVIGQFRVHGIILGKQKKLNDDNRLLWGLFQYADYMRNNIYEIAGYSIGPGIAFRTPKNQKHEFISGLTVAFMPMGAANSDYAPSYKVEALDSARTYNMGNGASAVFNFAWLFPIGNLTLDYSFWWVHTLHGAPGDEYIGIWEPKITFHITKNWYVGLQYLLYHRRGIYEKHKNIDLRNNEQRLFIAWRF